MKSSISDFLQAGNPNKAFQEHPPTLSFQSKVCSLMLAAVHGTDTLVSLIAAMSSWSLHHLGDTLIRLPLAVERLFQECIIRSAYGAVRNLEALTALTPKGFSKFPGSPGMHSEPGQSLEAGFSRLSSVTEEWQGLT